jgi:hydrophobic/amphiphilic exporter-1 (mainly G- bacteria), HAE1 family
LGGDDSLRKAMAVAVIGGLITSTALTLVIVPALFTVIDDIEQWLGPKFGRVLSTKTPGGQPQPNPTN